jgi:hypothetical protein
MTDIVKINDNYVKNLMELIKNKNFINNKLVVKEFDKKYRLEMNNINQTIYFFRNYNFYIILYIIFEYFKFMNFQFYFYLKLIQFDKYIVVKEKGL